MTSIPRRRFTLTDVVVMIAATAIGLALLRPALGFSRTRQPIGKWQEIEYSIVQGELYGTPILFAWSVALMALGLRHPRPPLRRVVRSAGFVLNSSGIAGVLFILVLYVGQIAIDPSRRARTYGHVLSTGLPGDVGYFVVGSLLTLALCGRCRPTPVWTDRVAYALGFIWIGLTFLGWSRLYLMLLR